jgi:hypothetical protein
VLAEPENSRKKLRSYRLVALAVSTLFFGYFSARFPSFWVLLQQGCSIGRPLGCWAPWRFSPFCLGSVVLGLMERGLLLIPVLLGRGWWSRCEGQIRDVMLLAKQPACGADPLNVYAVLSSCLGFTRASRGVILLRREARERGSPWTIPAVSTAPSAWSAISVRVT